jgi:hypothetical protein
MNTRLNHLRDDLAAWRDTLEREIQAAEQRLHDLKHQAQLLNMTIGIIDKVTIKPTGDKPPIG